MPTTKPTMKRLNHCHNIADLRAMARKRLPHFLFEYIDGGAFSETTLRNNQLDLQQISLRQRVLPVSVTQRSVVPSSASSAPTMPTTAAAAATSNDPVVAMTG